MGDKDLVQIVRDLGLLDWRSVLVGFAHGWMPASQVSDYASAHISGGEPPTHPAVQLAGLTDGDREAVEHWLRAITGVHTAVAEMEDFDLLRDAWRLAMLIKLRETIKDEDELLRRVADVRADFEYPEDMRGTSIYWEFPEPFDDSADSPIQAVDRLIRELQSRLVRS